MAKFSDILGGIAKDLVQAQVSADLSSMEALTHYQGNALLKNLDVPRFTLKDINMKLKFAISESAVLQQTDDSIRYAEIEWLRALNTSVVDQVIGNAKLPTSAHAPKIARAFADASASMSRPSLDMKNLLANKTNQTIPRSVDYLMKIYDKLPEELKKMLPASGKLAKMLKQFVTDALKSKLPSLKQATNAKAVLERDLEVVIEKAALEAIDNGQIHEITLTLTPDFIKFVGDGDNK